MNAGAKVKGPAMPNLEEKPVGAVQYSSDLMLGQRHGGGSGAGI